MAKVKAVMDHFRQRQAQIFGNIMSPPGTTDDTQAVAFDRSRNLFHPNAAGFQVQACGVLNVYQGRAVDSGCSSGGSIAPSRGWLPVVVDPLDILEFLVEYFQARSQVRLVIYSSEVELGTATADANGTVRASVRLPALNPGVHRLELQGVGTDGVQVTQEVLVKVKGRPSGSYATYLTGFQERPQAPTPDAPIETVKVTVDGVDVGDAQVDEHGGAFVSIPNVDRLKGNGPLTIEAVSSLTGKVARETVVPIPTAPSLWASDPKGAGVVVSGARFSADGLVHSESAVRVSGAGSSFTGGVEYGTTWSAQGGALTAKPALTRVAAGQGSPATASIADFRPGGRVADSGIAYTAVPAAQCTSGVWHPTPGMTGVVYVPCAVVIDTKGAYPMTIAAEGPVTVTAAGVTLGQNGPAADGQPSVVSGATGAAVTVAAADVRLNGQVVATNGALTVNGARDVLVCGGVARSISVAGADHAAPMAARCLAP